MTFPRDRAPTATRRRSNSPAGLERGGGYRVLRTSCIPYYGLRCITHPVHISYMRPIFTITQIFSGIDLKMRPASLGAFVAARHGFPNGFAYVSPPPGLANRVTHVGRRRQRRAHICKYASTSYPKGMFLSDDVS